MILSTTCYSCNCNYVVVVLVVLYDICSLCKLYDLLLVYGIVVVLFTCCVSRLDDWTDDEDWTKGKTC